MKLPTVGVAIPSIPPRTRLLRRALESVLTQTRQADAISVVIDGARAGASATRNRAWRSLRTEYVAFLDDDDEFEENHLEVLLDAIRENRAQMAYSWFTVIGGTDPFPSHFGRPWDPSDPVQTTITCMWKRSALVRIGGFPEQFEDGTDRAGNRAGEDLLAVAKLNAAQGKIVHVPERTWLWHHHAANTSGLPDRW